MLFVVTRFGHHRGIEEERRRTLLGALDVLKYILFSKLRAKLAAHGSGQSAILTIYANFTL